MNKNYCYCGCGNDLDAHYCKKCGKSLKEEESDIFPQPAPKPKAKKYPKEPEDGDSSVLSKRGRSYSPKVQPPQVQASQEDEEDEGDEGEGVSINFVPDVDNLEIEPINPLPKMGESWASLVQQAGIDNNRK